MPPGRNEPCTCGSGRKYKHCCGKAPVIAAATRAPLPDDAEVHYLRGQALEDQGLLEQAAESFGRATALRPGFADAHNDLGQVLVRLGRTEEAIASCRRALEESSPRTSSWKQRARATSGSTFSAEPASAPGRDTHQRATR